MQRVALPTPVKAKEPDEALTAGSTGSALVEVVDEPVPPPAGEPAVVEVDNVDVVDSGAVVEVVVVGEAGDTDGGGSGRCRL